MGWRARGWWGLWLALTLACLERGKAHVPLADDAAPVPAPVIDAGWIEARNPSGPAQADAEVRIALEAEPTHLDALIAQEAMAVRVTLGDVFEGLLCQDQPLAALRPCLASSYRVSDDGRRWQFVLRPGVFFHDGAPLTAADVRFSLEQVSKVGSILADELGAIDEVKLADDHIEVRFREPRLGRAEAFARLPIVPAHVPEAVRRRSPVGTGPLRFESWTPGQGISLARNARYWGAPSRIGRVHYRVVGSRLGAVAALRAGELDLVLQVPWAEARKATTESVGIVRYPMPAYLAAVYNTRRAPLGSVAVRRALTLLLDRGAVAASVFGAGVRPISGPFPASAELPAPLPYDPAAAAALLPATPLRLSILVPSESGTMARVADIWADDARPRVSLQVERRPFAEVLQKLHTHDFDIVMMSFSTGNDVDLFPNFHSSQVSAENFSGLADPSLDALLERARRAGREDLPLRVAIAERLAELQPYAFLVDDRRVGLVRADIGGFAAAGPYVFARHVWRVAR